ncbi:AzlD family protein [Mesorhizobium sp. M7A.F.Ca.US.006.04.2.1]|uniref:AzlD family protein n=1 Tax=unclassified Mesorhizobium TaxID=325217 RepID=UPI000FCC8143|nr:MULTISPECIES: AzlD family protein [unclassified Mesorhizobium]RUX75193.1 AzlD family protein [Mesorhizobium sp. M7A.F.Ca.US.005.03.1.1]RUY12278.1 AzlD family protein [Mesorhizobium sp. M7A.F.Ca.US.005.03.2.1]RUY28029.1 AzlD family protein [Mesorhizobium sp. M7A.F.Ca.US.001.04.2.1]RUY42560.1 AzlD family protein [Mesorhizobium sp. M7A.F.Ca.US.001.04.1.1]RVA03803.1 AzlD family protein [Mesorhizobium sp. M7A.F.Ca.US.001.02.1.1]
MIDATTPFTIVLMAGVTYLTRIGGYVVLRNRTLGARATAVMEAAPGCVLISVIAPAFVSKSPADLLALAVTLAAATRFSMLPTVLIGVSAAGLLRHLIG